MKFILFSLLVVCPLFASAQTFAGTYRSEIFNLFSNEGAVIAEFEVSADNTIKAKVKSGDSVLALVGRVEKNGKFEASTEFAGANGQVM